MLDNVFSLYLRTSKVYRVWSPLCWDRAQPYVRVTRMTEIRLATSKGHNLTIDQLLREKKVDIDDGDGRTALH